MKADGAQNMSEFYDPDSVLNKNFEGIKQQNRHKYNSNEMYLAESYEDILSTAIINKVSIILGISWRYYHPLITTQFSQSSNYFLLQVVTTKRRPLIQTSSNYNNSPNSPFKDDDENSREKDNKDAKKIFGNGAVGKNQLSNTAINLCKGDQSQLKANHNFAISNLENWNDQTVLDTQYYPGYVSSRLEPDIIPITAQKLRNNADCDATTEQMLTSRDSSITPPNLALTKCKEHEYDDYINTSSSGTV